jgi:ankyrin repeat protein
MATRTLLLALLSLTLCSCQRPEDRAKAELGREGIPATQASLLDASSQGNLPHLALLVRAGLDPRTPAEDGTTPLEKAAAAGQMEAVAWLLQNGAPPLASGKTSSPALASALNAGQTGTALRLLDAIVAEKPDLSLLNTFLAESLEQKNDLLIARLLELGADPKTADASGLTPLARAVQRNDAALLNRLLTAGADPNLPKNHPLNPLVQAVLLDRPGMAVILLERGADPDTRLPIHSPQDFLDAVKDEKMAFYLVKDSNLTVLMLAASRDQLEMVRTLLKHKADSQIDTDHYELGPVYLASVNHATASLLLLYGRNPDVEAQPSHIEISISRQRAQLIENGETVATTRISTGAKGFSTPKGQYVVTSKHKEWISTIYKAPMPYFLRLNCSPIGLHAGIVPDYPASHGCIRLPVAMAEKFFKLVDVGTPVRITD